jgi:hypothetical protein
MRNRNKEENITYKIVFDIVGIYLKEHDGPNFKVNFSFEINSNLGLFEQIHSIGSRILSKPQ